MNILFTISGLLLLTGAALYLTTLPFAPYLFAFGAAGLAVYQLTVPTKHLTVRFRRLQTLNVMASLLMVLASVLMFRQMNEWILCLTIAAILQLYTTFVASKEHK
jgi:hypothetical protein